ncbi:mu-protocadherin- cell-suface protein [Allorhodopirellula heiligendammensis]|uniref:mu-protocadherin- cell-suface protein n=1 Tax=Allorhodopirellula heiligendammensis TaxID=2714739 RepID=UPI00265D9030|nr:mu-protocadherin- cell-suface protein [Allorhodopirellula heiligendammensis]
MPTTLPGNRPNLPTTLPGTKPNLPTTLPGNKPNLPTTLPGTRPGLPGNRPNRPSLPNLGGGGSDRFPGGNHERPSAGDLGDFLGIGGGVRPTPLPGRLPNNPDNANRPNRPGNDRPGDRLPGNNRPGIDRPGNDRPGNDRPGNNRPGIDRPGNNRPGNNRPGIDRPGNNRPGNDRPIVNRPDNRPINIGDLNVGNTVINNRPSWSNINRTSVNRIQGRWGNQIGGLHGWAAAQPNRLNHWHSWGNDVRFRWNGYHHHNNWFAGNWWYSHPGGLCPYHYYHSFNRYPWNYWWRRPTWAATMGWFTWSAPATVWSQPIYYDYGSGGNVTYENNNVYINGEQVATADEFAESAAALATVTPPATEVAPDAGQQDAAESDDWMPLGTFALSTGEDDVEPSRIVQLAVDKSGIISGTVYNRETDQADAIQGRVDKDTQRVAMRLGSTDEVVAETGLYNLTQDEAPLLVHFGKDRVENYVLVRLEEPEDSGEADSDTDDASSDSAVDSL